MSLQSAIAQKLEEQSEQIAALTERLAKTERLVLRILEGVNDYNRKSDGQPVYPVSQADRERVPR